MASTKKVKIYHFSQVDKPSFVVDPNYFGQNSWTRHSARISPVAKSFFYRDLQYKEFFFDNYNLYGAEISLDKMIDLDKTQIYAHELDKLWFEKKIIGYYNYEQVVLYVPVKVFRIYNYQ